MSAHNAGPWSRILKALNPFKPISDADRRRAIRVYGNVITCSIGEIVDISATGARVRCRRFFRPLEGKPVSLAIEPGEGATPISLDGVVCWTSQEDATWFAGIAFTELSETNARILGDLLARGHGPQLRLSDAA